MNKELISKCCGAVESEYKDNNGNVFYQCSACGNKSYLRDDITPQPIQKEEEVKIGRINDQFEEQENEEKLYHEPTCRMRGLYLKGDALTGECTCIPKPDKPDWIKTPTSSDTFIEEKIEELSNLGIDVVCDNKVIETILFKDALSIVNQVKIECFLKSSLQEQRQSILEEIEKIEKEIDQDFQDINGTEYTNGFEDGITKIKQLLK